MSRGPKLPSGKTKAGRPASPPPFPSRPSTRTAPVATPAYAGERPRISRASTRPVERAPAEKPPEKIERARPMRTERDTLRPNQTPSGFWIWGRHAAAAALGNPERKLIRVVVTADLAAEPVLAAELAKLEATPPHILPKEEIQRLLPAGAVHQGLAVLTRALPMLHVEDLVDSCEGNENAVVIVLDQVTDPHNVGAVLRSAAAFGAAGVIMPERHAPEISGTLAKAASGAVDHLRLVRAVNLTRALDQLKKAGFWCIGLDGTAEATLASLKPSGRVCLVLGSEGEGLRRLTREACDLMARLPTGGPIASLNVSNAAAIALYEVTRQRSVET